MAPAELTRKSGASALLAAALLLAGCSGSAPTTPVLPGLVTMAPAPWAFDFPLAPPGVHIVTRAPSEAGRSSLAFDYNITGEAASAFVSVQDGGAAMVTPYIQRCGDNYSAQGAYASYRFWAGGYSTKLETGQTISLSVPLDTDHWTNVWGQQDSAGLAATLSDLCAVGFTFGNPAAGATAHGAYATAPQRFHVTRFEVQ